MKYKYWKQKWEVNDISFNQENPNDFLIKLSVKKILIK